MRSACHGTKKVDRSHEEEQARQAEWEQKRQDLHDLLREQEQELAQERTSSISSGKMSLKTWEMKSKRWQTSKKCCSRNVLGRMSKANCLPSCVTGSLALRIMMASRKAKRKNWPANWRN